MRNEANLDILLRHEGRLRGLLWAPSTSPEEMAKRIDLLFGEGTAGAVTDGHKELVEHRRGLPR